MAYSKEVRQKARSAYIYERLPLTLAAKKVDVSVQTLQNWKNKAKEAGDDWDKARDAMELSAKGLEEATAKMLRNHITQHNATMEMLEDGTIAEPIERVKALATAADSYSKLLAAHRKYSPQISELATALDVISFFSEYLEANHKGLLAGFIQVLEPFGEELSKRYG